MTTETTPTKSQIISARILLLLSQGRTLEQAMDTVLGAGAYSRLAGEVYEAMAPRGHVLSHCMEPVSA